MQVLVRPELPTASVGSSQATTAAVDNSAPLATRPQSTYKSGNVVQTSGATSKCLWRVQSGVGWTRLLAGSKWWFANAVSRRSLRLSPQR